MDTMDTIVGPSTSNKPYFTLSTSLEPEKLARSSVNLLKAVSKQPKLTQAFRLEVKFLQNLAEFKICLDPVLWYDVYLRTKPLAEAVEIAREYIDSTRRDIPPEEDGPFIVDYEETEMDHAYIPCNKKYIHPLGSCDYDHHPLKCDGKVITRDGREKTCDFYFSTKLIVEDFKLVDYVVLLRREPIRELLLLPRPDESKDNHNHLDNETLVQRDKTWRDLLGLQQKLKFNSIAINYGRWETGQSRDKYAQACHAHIHLLFDSEAWAEMKGTVSDKVILSKLIARNFPGPNYLLKDCMELEQQRLQSAEHRSMLIKLSEIADGNKSLLVAIGSLTDAIKDINKRGNERNWLIPLK